MCLLVSRLQSPPSGHDPVLADARVAHGTTMAHAGFPLPSRLVGPTGNACPMHLELSELRSHPFEIALGHRNHRISHRITLCASDATFHAEDPTQGLVHARQAVDQLSQIPSAKWACFELQFKPL